MRLLPLIVAGALLAVAGCGGGDKGYDSSPASTQATDTAPPPQPTTTAPRQEQANPAAPVRRKRTPQSLAACIREGAAGSQVLVKGRENEDAMFFEDLVGGRVDTVAVTPRGQSAEVDVFLFATPADARKAAPQAGGQGLAPKVQGSAVVVAPKAAPPAIASCLRATKYG